MKILEISGHPIKETLEITTDETVVLIGNSGGEANLTINLKKEGIEVQLVAALFGNNSQTYNIRTISHHKVPNTRSRVHVKGVFQDSSHFEYEGMIRIDNNAQLSDAYLQNDNLMIGDGVVVNSSPQLEILADDVKASHGVTISSLDEAQMYYMQSRGIPHNKASQLLIKGFFYDVLHNDDMVNTLLRYTQ